MIKGFANLTFAAINQKLVETQDSDNRKHLGASVIGRQCSREIWLMFHWAKKKTWDGRMLRLFQRGQLEESRFVEYLKNIGVDVWEFNEADIDPKTGKPRQWRVNGHKGHFGGSLDGVARGIPELGPLEAFVTEFKTHNAKSFAKLQANGVKESKWEHYVQMQIYMNKMRLRYALYMAVDKDTDEIYAEIVPYDAEVAEGYLRRAGDIIFNEEAPPKLHSSESGFGCKFCDMKGLCHRNEVPEINCRTCVYSAPGEDGAWVCKIEQPEIKEQTGCANHIFNPHLLNGARVVNENLVDSYIDLVFFNKFPLRIGPQHCSSKQLQAMGLPQF